MPIAEMTAYVQAFMRAAMDGAMCACRAQRNGPVLKLLSADQGIAYFWKCVRVV